jgi:hypothetical protein
MLSITTLIGVVSILVIALWPATRMRREMPAYLAAVQPNDAVRDRWSQRLDGATELVLLDNGTFRLKIADHPAARRVVIQVPDGEIDDLGTVFEVMVSAGRTQRVAVEFGQVVVRLRGLAPVALSTGDSWDRAIAPGPLDGISVAQPGRAKRLSHRFQREDAIHRSPPASAPELRSGSDLEDAAYLHVVQLVRAARMSEATAAAVEYLQRFPEGFRHDEMRVLVDEQGGLGAGGNARH